MDIEEIDKIANHCLEFYGDFNINTAIKYFEQVKIDSMKKIQECEIFIKLLRECKRDI